MGERVRVRGKQASWSKKFLSEFFDHWTRIASVLLCKNQTGHCWGAPGFSGNACINEFFSLIKRK
jgi:hypothetical protein